VSFVEMILVLLQQPLLVLLVVFDINSYITIKVQCKFNKTKYKKDLHFSTSSLNIYEIMITACGLHLTCFRHYLLYPVVTDHYITSSLLRFVDINMYNILQDDKIEEQDKPSHIIDSTITLSIFTRKFNASTANHVILYTKYRRVR
jgi:hypothetical protein